MSRRIEIELTSARPDGTWTWRAAGAREPKGEMTADVVPGGSKVGDLLKVEAEFNVDGIDILSVVEGQRARKEAARLELLPVERPFEPVTQQLARKERRDDDRRDRRRDRDDADRRGPRSERPGADRAPRADRDRPGRGPRTERPARGDGADRGPRERRASRPAFTPPPEMPQRPKPKRLKPGRAHRSAVLANLPEEQRPIAELTLQGLAAVRQRLRDDNAKLREAGKDEMPEASVMKMAEELMPKVRVAEWLDRAEAARKDLAELDLRDLRSVVASSEDPIVAREESTRALAAELKAALASKQEQATGEWLEDIATAVEIGRVVRALKLAAEPPKAGTRFPADLAARLAGAAAAGLTPDASSERWLALVESVAFSPVRTLVQPTAAPTQVSDELRAAVTKLAPAIPQIAALFGIVAPEGAPMPKPPRITRRPDKKPAAKPAATRSGQARPAASAPAETAAVPQAEPAADHGAVETPETPSEASDQAES
jgi:hypothetical protein